MTYAKNETSMKDIKLVLDDGRVLQFQGKLIAGIDSSRGVDITGKEYESVFWKKYKLYITQSNKSVLYYAEMYRSRFQKEKYKVFPSEQELIEYAIKKDKKLLFNLLKKAAIPVIIEID